MNKERGLSISERIRRIRFDLLLKPEPKGLRGYTDRYTYFFKTAATQIHALPNKNINISSLERMFLKLILQINLAVSELKRCAEQAL